MEANIPGEKRRNTRRNPAERFVQILVCWECLQLVARSRRNAAEERRCSAINSDDQKSCNNNKSRGRGGENGGSSAPRNTTVRLESLEKSSRKTRAKRQRDPPSLSVASKSFQTFPRPNFLRAESGSGRAVPRDAGSSLAFPAGGRGEPNLRSTVKEPAGVSPAGGSITRRAEP